MRLLRLATIVAFILSCAAYVYTEYFYDKDADTVPPVITADEEVLELSVNDSEKGLLSGLEAEDDRDGDITDRIMVSSESYFLEDAEMSVRYVVFDEAHNSASFKRKVRYSDYTSPEFTLDEPLIFRVGKNVLFKEKLHASDCIEGDVTSRIRLLSNSISSYMEGVYPIRAEVMNKHGDKSEIELNVLVLAEEYTPEIQLTDYIKYIDKDSEFDPYSLIESAVDSSGRKISSDKVRITGSVNTSQTGSYTLFYSTDNADMLHGVYLTVVVREAEK